MKKLYAFYEKQGFTSEIPLDAAVSLLLKDMEKGLDTDFQTASSMDMIPLWKNLPESLPKNEKIIVIDAGGTNFRTCLVTFDADGNPSISSFFKHPMPALDREMSNEQFFDAIACYLAPLKDAAKIISFCFSFAIKIDPEGGGEAIKLSKEIKLPDIASCKINDGLKTALIKKGWKTIKKILMVNDTAAVLQSGLLIPESVVCGFDTNIGFVLGTGLNSAYIEYGKVKKLKGTPYYEKPQIIVCESGKSCTIPQSDFDKKLSQKSKLANDYFLERMCSGRYLGELCSIAVKEAALQGIFSEPANKALLHGDYTTEQVSAFLKEQNHTENIFSSALNGGELSSDYAKLHTICSDIFERAARLSASVIAACCLKTDRGKNPEKPICITADGSAFLKGYLIKEKIFLHLHRFLTEKNGIYFKILTPQNPVILGTALSAFLK